MRRKPPKGRAKAPVAIRLHTEHVQYNTYCASTGISSVASVVRKTMTLNVDRPRSSLRGMPANRVAKVRRLAGALAEDFPALKIDDLWGKTRRGEALPDGLQQLLGRFQV